MMNGEPNRKLLVGNLKSVRVVLDVRDIVNAYYLLMINEGANERFQCLRRYPPGDGLFHRHVDFTQRLGTGREGDFSRLLSSD